MILAGACQAQPLSVSTSAYEQNSHYLPVASRAYLQAALDTFKIVRLDANADYSNGVSAITIHSDQKLYGLTGTILPPITVAPGTQRAVISCIQTTSITFPSSAQVTANNLFLRIKAAALVQNASLENNLIVDWMGGLNLDNSIGGHMRNNRFIRSLAHGNYNPYLSLKGNAIDPSFGNVFLFYNFLTPPGDGAIISGQKDVTFVGVDGESWNWFGWGAHALITTSSDVGTLRFFVANGSDNVHAPTDKAATGYFDVGATNFMLYNDIATSANPIKTHLQASMSNALLWNILSTTIPGSGFKKDNTGTLVYPSATGANPLRVPADAAAPLESALNNATAGRPGVPWEAPVYDVIPDPAGPGWSRGLSSMPDSSAYIQNLIDTQTTAFLPAGTYYISQPIRLKASQGLIGAGMSKTVVIAMSPSIDMIVGADHASALTAVPMTLGDLTLEGGLNGIHHEPNGSGAGAMYNEMFFSHVTMRNMANSCIFIDSIGAWDNNLIDHVNFVNCGTGIKQRVSPTYSGGQAPGQNYLDKNVFYRCQFVGNSLALDLAAQRANNVNVWVENLFDSNTNGVAQFTNNFSSLIANSDFRNNGGTSVLYNDGTNFSIVSSRFTAGYNGQIMLRGTYSVEGSLFSQGGGTASINTSGGVDSFYNSTSLDMPLGQVMSGYFLNSQLFGRPDLSRQAVSLQNGVRTVISAVAIVGNPLPQLLVGSPLGIQF